MDDYNEIYFWVPNPRDWLTMNKAMRDWYNFNKDRIEIISQVYHGIIKPIPDDDTSLRNCYIRYKGPATVNPLECDHSSIHKTVSREAQCTISGIRKCRCGICGLNMPDESIPKLGHNWADPVTKREPTCEEPGISSTVCERCGAISNETPIPALGHNWGERTVMVQPTCETAGSERVVCTRCGFVHEESPIEPLGHIWRSNGDGTHTCRRPGCNQTESCYPLGEGLVCEKCGYTIVAAPLEITTDFIEGMAMNVPTNQVIRVNKPATITWSIESGSLPPGIELNQDGTITGTPTAYGTYNVTIKADSGEETATKVYSINVARAIYTVTFDPMGGSTYITTKQVAAGGTIGELPDATMEGMHFGGWFTATTGGLRVTAEYTISSNVTLYARYGETADVDFGDSTSTFNIAIYGDRTNYANGPYTLYNRVHGTTSSASDLIMQVGISSENGSNMMNDDNRDVTLYLKLTNPGEARSFDVGFDADSYVVQTDKTPHSNNDHINIRIIENGLLFGAGYPIYTLTCPYEDHTAWVGQYSSRTSYRYTNQPVGTESGTVDSGFTLTVNDVFINSGSYIILEFHFTLV